MIELDRIGFIIMLAEAAKRLEAKPRKERYPVSAARVAIEVGMAPSGVGIGDDIVQAVGFYANLDTYTGSHGALVLMSRLWEERAFASYQKHLPKKKEAA